MIVNKSSGQVLVEELRVLRNVFSKSWGALFKNRLREGLVFPFKRSSRLGAAVHTFFVFTPLTVVWLDNGFRVVDVSLVKPFSVAVPRHPAKFVVELPPECFGLVREGDVLEFSRGVV